MSALISAPSSVDVRPTGVDEERARPHHPELPRADQATGLFAVRDEQRYVVGAIQQLLKLGVLDAVEPLLAWRQATPLVVQHVHVKRLDQFGQDAAGLAKADDPSVLSNRLPISGVFDQLKAIGRPFANSGSIPI